MSHIKKWLGIKRQPKNSSEVDPAARPAGNTPANTPTNATPRRKVFPHGIKQLYDSENSVVDIIFVHGLTGDREETWTSKNTDSPWPQSLLPSKIANARILTFGYDAYVVKLGNMVSQNTIGNHAMNLLTSVATFREENETNDRPIIFVCHSLGGLVCEDALSAASRTPEKHLRAIIDCTCGIIFLGTPHRGSALANWAGMLAVFIGILKQTNPKIVEALERDSEVLARVQEGFYTMIRSRNQDRIREIKICCCYEELPLPGIGFVVPKDSAIIPGYIPIGIHDNHMGMTRFESEDDPGFIAITGELRRWIKEVTKLAATQDRSEEPNQTYRAQTTQLTVTSNTPGTNLLISGSSGSQIGQNYGNVFSHSALPPPSIIASPFPSSNVPFRRDPDFVDSDTLSELIQKCSGEASRVALVGLGGVGKSQLAIEFSHRTREDHPRKWVFWVHAGNTARFREGYKTIAEEAKIDGRDKTNNILQLVSNWLCVEANGQWVMIVDNADDQEVLFKQIPGDSAGNSLSDYLPQSKHGSTILTTRSQNVAFKFTGRHQDIIPVKPMDETRALLLLDKKLPKQSADMTDAPELAKELDYMPLAISQAAAYISQNSPRMNIARYLRDFRGSDKTREALLQKDAGDNRRDRSASNSVITTWHISFNRIREERPSAAQLLSLMCLFDRQGIPEGLLLQKYQGDKNDIEVDFNDDLSTLTAYSLVTTNVNGDEFEMHRLVQLSTRNWLEICNELENWKEIFIGILAFAYPWPDDSLENWRKCGKLFPHAQMILSLRPKNEAFLESWGGVLHIAAWHLRTIGNYKNAEEMQRRSIEAKEKVLGKEHPSTLASLSNLATMLRDQGIYKKAEEITRQALEVKEQVLGKEHPETFRSLCNLAAVLKDQGIYKEAEEINRQVLEVREKVLGNKHPETLASLNNLATVLQDQGKYKEAEELSYRALEGKEDVLGKHHPSTLITVYNIALILRHQAKNEDALKLFQRVYTGWEKSLGPKHPRTRGCYISIQEVQALLDGQASSHSELKGKGVGGRVE